MGGSIEFANIVQILAAAGGGILVVVAFLDKRAIAVRAEVEKEMQELRTRIERLETGTKAARSHIRAALQLAAHLPGSEPVIEELIKADGQL